MNDDLPVQGALEIIPFVALTLGLLFIVWRLLRGPSLPDRVVALDMLGLFALAFLVMYAVVTDTATMIDVALVIALLAFLGTVAFAYYLEKGTLPRQDEGGD